MYFFRSLGLKKMKFSHVNDEYVSKGGFVKGIAQLVLGSMGSYWTGTKLENGNAFVS